MKLNNILYNFKELFNIIDSLSIGLLACGSIVYLDKYSLKTPSDIDLYCILTDKSKLMELVNTITKFNSLVPKNSLNAQFFLKKEVKENSQYINEILIPFQLNGCFISLFVLFINEIELVFNCNFERFNKSYLIKAIKLKERKNRGVYDDRNNFLGEKSIWILPYRVEENFSIIIQPLFTINKASNLNISPMLDRLISSEIIFDEKRILEEGITKTKISLVHRLLQEKKKGIYGDHYLLNLFSRHDRFSFSFKEKIKNDENNIVSLIQKHM